MNVSQIPQDLRRKPQWVHWKHEKRGGDVTKIPYQANGAHASSTDPSTWSPLDELAPLPQRVSGVGFVFAADGDFFGVDIDDCVQGGVIAPEAQAIIDRLDTYTEFSPSGNGVHIIGRGFLPDGGRRTSDVPGTKEVEMYDEARYFTMTGDHVPGTRETVENRARELHELHKELFPPAEFVQPTSEAAAHNIPDNDLLQRISNAKPSHAAKFNQLWKGNTSGYGSQSEADQALCNILAFWTGGDESQMDSLFRQSGLYREKWERDDYRSATVGKAISGCTEFYEPGRQGEGGGAVATAEVAQAAVKTAGRPEKSNGTSPTFWSVDDSGKASINRTNLVAFWTSEGYGKIYDQDDLSSSLVREQNRVVEHTSAERIKDQTIDYARKHAKPAVVEKLMKGGRIYFSEPLMEYLPVLGLDFKRDTPNASFFYYRNGFVEVTAEGFDLHPYTELDGVIWKDQIIDRKFTSLQGSPAPIESDWNQFLKNITGGDENRLGALTTAIGYLLHGYRDPAVSKAVIFMDETDSDVPNGRTGKSVVAKALGHMVPTARIDARNFSFDSRFAFQQVDFDTRVADFNDASKKFDFERLFSCVTDDWSIERKNKDLFTIPFDEAPKVVISTNYVIEGQGDSFRDRVFQVEFAPHYTADYKPTDEFGARFFTGWDADAWAAFDNLMVAFVRCYLNDGLHAYEHVNLDTRRLKQHTCKDFAEWILDFVDLDTEYEKDALWRTFKSEYAPDYDDLTKRKFGYWLSSYARTCELDKIERKRRQDDTRVRYVTFKAND